MPDSLLLVLRLDPKGAKVCTRRISVLVNVVFNFGSFLPKDARVNLVDLVKSFLTSIQFISV